MCGINGFSFSNKQKAEKMNAFLIHRGPDSCGVFYDNHVTLSHTRLKIIDLSENANQPMSDSQEKIWIVFNGEIYNFEEIKRDLLLLGYKFKTKSDTEVIINSYKQWGYDCVNFFNGMWAFVIYDKLRGTFFLSRDRLGKKPLYYTFKDGGLIFSSEIRPLFVHEIERSLNKRAVSSFLSYRQVLGKETMFKNIFKLPPASNMVFNINTQKIEREWEYWDVNKTDILLTEDQAKYEVERILSDAVSIRQVADVPIGSINSGGLDSSIVSSLMASINAEPIKTFTVKFPEIGYDETPFAQLLSERYATIHKEIIVDVENFFDLMKEYASIKDEPIGVPNEIALYLLFREIKKSLTVVLSGEGADEIFAGYSRIFRSPYDFYRLKEIQEKGDTTYYQNNYVSLFKKYNGLFFKDEIDHFMFLYNYFPDNEKNYFLKKEAIMNYKPFFKKFFNKVSGSYEKKISYIFLKIHLLGLLLRLDNSSMYNSVEVRCPFLDYRLINLVFNLPFSMKNPWKSLNDQLLAISLTSDEIAEKYDLPKYLLKKLAKKYIPQTIIERKKQGFPLPLQKWFGERFYDEAKRLLISKDSKINIVINTDKLQTWIENQIQCSDKNFGLKLWMLVSLELWLRQWF